MNNELMTVEQKRAITSLKGISALIIACVYHVAAAGFFDSDGTLFMQNNVIIKALYTHGMWLVKLFFIISGVVFWLNYAPKIRQKEYVFKNWIKRRIVRIYPVMITTLLMATIMQEIYRHHFGYYWLRCADNNLFTFVLNLIGLQILFPYHFSFNCPAWALTIFFVCWIIFYLIVTIANGNKKYELYFCMAMILLGLTIIICYPESKMPFLSYSFGRGYSSFFMGGCMMLTFEKASNKQRKYIGNVLLIILIGICLLKTLLKFELGTTNIALGCIIFPIMLWVVLEVKPITKILSIKPLVILGNISFSLYLSNFFTQNTLAYCIERWLPGTKYSSAAFWWCHFICNILMAIIVYVLIEKKLTKFIVKRV